MVYKKFSFGVVILSVLVALCGTLFLWSLSQDYLKVARFTFFGFWCLSIYLLVNYVNRNNRSLERFLDVLCGNDRLGDMQKKGKSFGSLNEAFNTIMDSLSSVRIEKEEQFHFFRMAVEQVGVGLLAFDERGKVLLLNAGAKKLLDLSHLHNICDLSPRYPGLEKVLEDNSLGDNQVLPLIVEGELRKLSIRITSFVLRGQRMKMVSFQDIRTELESGELEAWQKLIRVITHEIMNSITPMKTLSTTLLRTFDKDGAPCSVSDLDTQKLSNTLLGLMAIQKRCEGLTHFVQSYRSITRIPKPDIEVVSVKDLFRDVEQLIAPDMQGEDVSFEVINNGDDLELLIDAQMIAQVLINLLRNALIAVNYQSDPTIEMGAQKGDSGNVIIYIKDNGEGMDEQTREQIFVPFYTTRKEGSGIGLSFSQQVMRLHKGEISVWTEPGKGSCFELQF